MTTKEKILVAVSQNQPAAVSLPELTQMNGIRYADPLSQYEASLAFIGGKAIRVGGWEEIKDVIKSSYPASEKRILSLVPELKDVATEKYKINPAAHHLADVELAIISAQFAVAENGAVWVTEDQLGHRAVPFICQHLVAVVPAQNVVNNMHEAYQLVSNAQYGFGAFIAGPSKTADIEQSLVLGAHGPRSMTVFVLG